ncbi:44627_t:CDS:2, partial [Gigaspora margarita]
MSFLCRYLSHRALEEAISIERSTSLPLEPPECFKVRGLEKNWFELTKEGREPTSLYQEVTLDRVALFGMEELCATKKGIMVQAILDVANATSDQILSRNFPQTQFPIRSRVIYMNENRSQFVD